MKAIGVRELRQRASEYLSLVEAGRTLAVTARGRAVAWLVPVRRAGRRELLVTRGRIVPGAGDLLDLGPPLPASPRVPLPSQRLRKARAVER
jgi:prevent-host-death family protein